MTYSYEDDPIDWQQEVNEAAEDDLAAYYEVQYDEATDYVHELCADYGPCGPGCPVTSY